MSAPVHPSVAQLRAFSEGHISADERTNVALHLDTCADCCTRLDKLFTQDAMLARLQTAVQPEGRIVIAESQRRQAARALQRQNPHSAASTHCRADTSTADVAADQTDTLPPFFTPAKSANDLPRAAGDYEILEELGRGGMGVVYKARHRTLNRLVALKMLHKGTLAEGEPLARFREEAKVVARLQHPGIVQIHEVGTLENQPYLALEYVPGSSLDRQLQGTPQPPHAAAALLKTLAETMHAAHQQNVIHRDLKPANVLLCTRAPTVRVAESPAHAENSGARAVGARLNEYVPKITDFGLAKPLDEDSGLTRTGIIVGTPYYMAPEQAAGQKHLGPAADIYSLGAILYETLTGRPPFKGVTAYDTIHLVQNEEPVPPRVLQPGSPADLETICLKCLHKEPVRRYATAADLAADLGRFLEGRPITARPVGRLERTWRWCRRNPVVAGLSAAMLLILLAASVTGWLLAAWALQAEETAKQERDTAQQQRLRAEDNFTQARRAVDETYLICSEHPLFAAENMHEQRRLLLSKALPFYQSFQRQKSDDPAIQAEQGSILYRLAYIYCEVGPAADAIPTAQEAVAIFQRLVAARPNEAEYLYHLVLAWNTLGMVQQQQAHAREGLASMQHAYAQAEHLFATWPKTRNYKELLSRISNNLGSRQRDLGHVKEGLDSFARALQLKQELLDDQPQSPDAQLNLARSWSDLGLLHYGQQQLQQAITCHGAALRLLEPLHEAHPQQREFARTLGGVYCNVGNAELDKGLLLAAVAHYRQGLRVLKRTVTLAPTDVAAKRFLRNTFIGRANALRQLRRASASWQDMQRGLPLDDGTLRERMLIFLAEICPMAQAEQTWLMMLAGSLAAQGGGPARVAGELTPWLLWTSPEPER